MALSLTKFTHACVRLEAGDTAVVFDPGVFSPDGELPRALDGAAAVLITHQHADHLAPDALRAAVRSNGDLTIHAPRGVAEQLEDLGDAVVVTTPGESFTVGPLTVRTYGGHHAVIHPLIEAAYVDNLGFHVSGSEGSVYHPGDSFVVPAEKVDTLLTPAHAPWSKSGEVIDFVLATRPAVAHPVHDGLLSERGNGGVDTIVGGLVGTFGVDWQRLDPGERRTV